MEKKVSKRRLSATPSSEIDSTAHVKNLTKDDKDKILVIVESPSKAKTINKYLGNNFQVKASVGHVKELPRKEIGIDFDNDYMPKYVIIKGKEKVVKELKDYAKQSSKIILATDPDREGEAIAWHISNELTPLKKNISRALFNEITPNAVRTALEHLRDLDYKLVQSQQARQGIDKIVGYKISPFLWKTVLNGLSAGRVQSVALRLLCERQSEIDAFTPVEYWTILAEFITNTNEIILAKLAKIDLKDVSIRDEPSAKAITEEIKTLSFSISQIRKRDQKRNAPAPFITSTLQQAASNKFAFSSKRTMALAQQLYEGITFNGEPMGLITYMHAHEAIRPTSVYRRPQDLKTYLDKNQYQLYELIWQRFLASQMAAALFEQTSVDITDNKSKYLFRANGRKVLFEGFLKTFTDQNQLDYEEKKSTKEDTDNEDIISILPTSINEKDPLAIKTIIPNQHFTKPPSRYSEASLVKELDNYGIGRPSTYAAILSTLVERGYVDNLNRRLTPTELGKDVNKILIANFSQLFNVTYTAEMESNLDKIATGETDYIHTMDNFYKPFIAALLIREKNPILPQNENQRTCPKCQRGTLIIKWTKRGKFIGCSLYPKCDHIESNESSKPKAIVTHVLCPKCNKFPMVVRIGKFGKFLGCSGYTEIKCNGALNLTKQETVMPPKMPPLTVNIPCPNCKTDMYLRRGKRGAWLGCANFPKCKGRKTWSSISTDEQSYYQRLLSEHEKKIQLPEIKTTDGTPLDFSLKIEDLIVKDEPLKKEPIETT
ncbi:hypothetical protein CHS0354_000684 [Potamilus streckersoni]|uniref:DNA topoisomerase n=1 Tax=Potamilus streckersoni TaxID=2493646 RepID=A0AAE0T754_9BIVA|nr:hypothetical protein CHS0354_000684 [Potamilus streckersoni]